MAILHLINDKVLIHVNPPTTVYGTLALAKRGIFHKKQLIVTTKCYNKSYIIAGNIAQQPSWCQSAALGEVLVMQE